eukprot:CAMPEP_0205817468 /NCGR_PEP_ID=MMETSP0205-20121125/24394_1 /ASSEMBLY_ACC=CAM_ASM_000278 /TAXON_ID=36767 /ORGANISM="Euplotes focardii, Strain TN1" /LENGTH=59 /DNA_ID=CAMNT_0053108121 /DNA_START=659 /DNA_END=834 /DNA_ORIENTATION=-
MESAVNASNTSPNENEGEGAEKSSTNMREYLTSIFKLKERITFWKSHYLANREVQASLS